MKDYLKRFTQNLLILLGIIIFMGIFTWIFYPEALDLFWAMGEVFSGLNLWAIVILSLIISALPRRK